MAVYETYVSVGEAEDIQDMIYNISPVDNPVAAMSKTIRATGVIHQWQEDVLRAAASNKAVEGADAAGATHTPTVMRTSNTQIFTEEAEISGTLEVVQKYGPRL